MSVFLWLKLRCILVLNPHSLHFCLLAKLISLTEWSPLLASVPVASASGRYRMLPASELSDGWLILDLYFWALYYAMRV